MRRLNLTHTVNKKHPLNRGLISGWLALPQGSRGGIFRDLMRRNHGTLTNGPTWGGALGRPGGWGSLTTAGVGYVDAGGTTSLDVTTGDFTFGCWCKWTGANTVGFPMCKTTGSGTSGYEILLGEADTTGAVSVRLNSTSATFHSGSWNDGIWHRIVSVRLGGTAYLYIDGVLRNSAANSANLTNTSAPMNFFARNGSVLFNGGGSVDDCFVAMRGWTAAEVLADFNESRTGRLNTLNWIKKPLLRPQDVVHAKIGPFVHAPWQRPFEVGAWR